MALTAAELATLLAFFNARLGPCDGLVMAGSNSAAELKSQPGRCLFEDEVDEYPDNVDGLPPKAKAP